MAVITYPNDRASLILNGFAITDLAEGDVITVTHPNPSTEHTNSANGGVSITKRNDANVTDVVVRVQKHSASDLYLNSLFKSTNPTLVNGTLRSAFNRDGTAMSDSWSLQNGSATAQPTETVSNQTDNGVMEYGLKFRSGIRSI